MIGNNYRNYESCNLDEWIKIHSSENDMKELFFQVINTSIYTSIFLILIMNLLNIAIIK